MKLTTLFLLAAVMQVSATGYSQQKVSLKVKNARLEQVFREIKKQTGFTFAYNNKLLAGARTVTVRLQDVTVSEALSTCFAGQPYTYQIIDKIIVIRPKPVIIESVKPIELPLPLPPVDITVIVQDSAGQPLEGASIRVKGTQRGTTADANGYAVLKSVAPNSTLVISFTGYSNKEVKIGSNNTFTIRLTALARNLEDVVIVGYGTQKRRDVTGAIASIGPTELKQSPVADISNALAGRLPGLITVQNSGEPGADGANLSIRGYGTTGNNNPLVVVDGIERDFSTLDPNEVANITILKDAASTAIYGIRGANGVILVTSRRGANVKPSISVTAQNGWQSPTRLPKYADSYDALKLYREGLENDGLNTSQYSDSILNLYRDRSHPAYQYLYPDVDWLHTMLKPFSYMSQFNLNVTGGNDFAKYFVSMSYLQQNGLYNFQDQIKQYNIQAVTNKYNFRSNIDLQITKSLTMELNLGAIVRDRNYPGTSAQDLFSYMKSVPSWYFPLVNPDGSVPGDNNTGVSAYDLLVNSGYQRFFETTLQSTAGFKWDMHYFLKGLSSRVRLSFDNLNYRNVSRPLSGSTYKYNLLPGVLADTVTDLAANGTYQTINQGNGTLDYQVTANGQRRTTLELYLNYDREFGKHSVHAVVVYNQSSYFADVATGQANAIAGLPYKYDGLVGRLSYNYDDRYLLELDGGYNGSENFAPGHRLGFFPAVSAGWVISKEKFIAGNPTLSFINNLKLRGSYGLVGNDQIGGSRFLYQTTWTITAGGYQFGANRDGNSYSGAQESQIGNPGVTWEKSQNADIGMDLSLWKDGLTITADYFRNHRTNILLTSQLIPATLGLITIPPTNGGIINNHGYEVQLEHRKNFGKQGYDIRFNYSYARNKIIYYAEPSYTGREWQAITGTEVNEQYGYTALGLFKNAQDIAKSPDQSGFGAIQPGDIKYKDLNGDGVINSLDAGYEPGKVSVPKSILGLSLSYHYASFDISVFFQAALGGTVLMSGSGIFPFDRFSSVLQDVINNHWVASDPNRNYEFPRMSSQPNVNNEQNSTFWLRSGNYLRLKTFEVGYAFPGKWMKQIGFKNARAFANGINLLTWDKLKIFDPEISSGGTGTYPQQKVINAGLTFSF
jgi:TonB-linked SusC/RagA family outer membrane protein